MTWDKGRRCEWSFLISISSIIRCGELSENQEIELADDLTYKAPILTLFRKTFHAIVASSTLILSPLH